MTMLLLWINNEIVRTSYYFLDLPYSSHYWFVLIWVRGGALFRVCLDNERNVKYNIKIIGTSTKERGTTPPSENELASGRQIHDYNHFRGLTPNCMMDWKYYIISEASLQCLSRIFFLGRKPIFPQELRHFNLPRRAENGITIEARIPECRRGRPALCRELPGIAEVRREQNVPAAPSPCID